MPDILDIVIIVKCPVVEYTIGRCGGTMPKVACFEIENRATLLAEWEANVDQ